MISVAAAGPQILIDYPRFLIDSTKWVETNGVQPFYLFGLNGLLTDLLKDQTPPQWLLWPLTAAVVGLALSTWRAASWENVLPLMSVAIVASLLINLHLYLHEMLLVSLAIGFAAAHTTQTAGNVDRWGMIAAAMWVCHLPILVFAYKDGFPLFTLSTIALFAVLLRDAWRLQPKANAELCQVDARAAA